MSCWSPCRARAASSDAAEFPARLAQLFDRHGILWVDDEVQSGTGRTGPVWAVEHSTAPSRTSLVSGKSLGGGLPLAAVAGQTELMDAVHPGGVGGTFGGNPRRLRRSGRRARRGGEPEFQAAALALGERLRARLDDLAARVPGIGEVRGLGPMLALELEERRPDRAAAAVAAAYDRGLLLLSCGLDGNVVRLLPPLTIADDDLDLGLASSRRRLRRRLSGRRRLRSSDVRLVGLRKRFGDVAAVDGVDLEIRRGEFFTMLGPSGSGKTTTLRVIAGFERPDEGRVSSAASTSPGSRPSSATSTPSSRTTRSSRT